MLNLISGGTINGNVYMGQVLNFPPPAETDGSDVAMGAQLPRHYVNNAKLFEAMDAVHAQCRAENVPTRMLLCGLPGLGATAAGDQWVVTRRGELPEKHLRASLGSGFMDAAAILEHWLDQLRAPKEDRPSGAEALSAYFRARTANLPLLVFVDGAATEAQVRLLLPGSSDSVVLITSRARLNGLVGGLDVVPFAIDPLDEADSDDLLARVARLGEQTRAARLPLVRACAGIPLAVRIIAAQLLSLGPDALTELVAQLSDRGSLLEALDVPDDTSLPRMLEAMYRSLDAEGARAYRLLGLHPTLLVDADAIRALLDTTGPLGRTVNALLMANLLDRRAMGYYLMNGVVHEHAWSIACRPEHAEEREAALDRILEYYTAVAESGEALRSGRWRHDPAGAYRRLAETPGTDAVDRNRVALVAAVETANRTGRHDLAWRICQGLWTHCLQGGHHADWIKALTFGVASAMELASAGESSTAGESSSAETSADTLALARMHYELGFALLDRYDTAEEDPRLAQEHLEEALVIARGEASEGHRRTESSVLEALALLRLRQGRAETALELLDQALAALDGIDHRRGRTLLGYHRGRVLTALRRHEDAERELLEARDRFAELGDTYNVARSLTRLAEDRVAAALPAQALTWFTRALETMPVDGRAYQRAAILCQRGDLSRDVGDRDGAVADWTLALAGYEETGSPLAVEVRERLSEAGF
ncbi:tetratricopeptide repeat protein [Streptomyces kaniharaensis]|uniref:Tetratricopeptide repeat protein n=1 Tax=Streptomyces kaniharaensis TaxID=212423 RepID=A0A6N7KM21_9ACTN|nr:tetratricopeptide repeat protein [Streptomyces kaniharaensis]MQS11609.1 tetratricopeptide repeat protein [Streptomyces kaniharaensis]